MKSNSLRWRHLLMVAGFFGSMSPAAEAATIIYGYTTTTGSFGAGFVTKNSWQDAVDEAKSFAPIGTHPNGNVVKHLAGCSGGGYNSIAYKLSPITIAGACGYATQQAADLAAKSLCGSDCGQGDKSFDPAPLQTACSGTFAAASTTTPTCAATSTPRDEDRLFDYAEKTYPSYFTPVGTASQTLAGYYLRFYPATNTYIGVKDGAVWLLTNNQLVSLGTLTSLLTLVK